VTRITTPTIRPAVAPGTLWVKQPGHGTYDNDRPPIIHIISRETGEERCWVVAHSDKETCHGILGEAVRPTGTIVYSNEECSYHGIEP
jgi:transposase